MSNESTESKAVPPWTKLFCSLSCVPQPRSRACLVNAFREREARIELAKPDKSFDESLEELEAGAYRSRRSLTGQGVRPTWTASPGHHLDEWPWTNATRSKVCG